MADAVAPLETYNQGVQEGGAASSGRDAVVWGDAKPPNTFGELAGETGAPASELPEGSGEPTHEEPPEDEQ